MTCIRLIIAIGMAAAIAACSSPSHHDGGSLNGKATTGDYRPLSVITDFENGADEWDASMSNVRKKPTVEIVDDAKVGKHSGKITFRASPPDRKEIDWTLLFCPIEKWPSGGDCVAFWIKSTSDKTMLRVKLSEMSGNHNDYEGYKRDIEAGTEWQHLVLPLKSFEYLWGHAKDHILESEKISNISFAQSDVTKDLVIFVDQIEIVHGK